MVPGDISFFTTHDGQRRVAVVLEVLSDGKCSIFCPKPSYLAVPTSAKPGELGTLFDPTLPADVSQEAVALADAQGKLVSLPAADLGDVEGLRAVAEVSDQSATPDQGE